MSFVIIKNVNILTMNKDKDIIEKGVVVIKDNIILDLGGQELLQKYNSGKIIDGNDGILIPGMINTHTHSSMVVFRSLADDVKDRLKRYLFPLENMLVDRDLVRLGAEYAIAEMLLGGVTTFTDMYYFEDEVASAAEEYCIRAVLGETIINFPSPDSKKPYGGLDYATHFIEKWKNNNLITPAVAPHAPYTNDDVNLKRAAILAEKHNIPITMHVAEMSYEYDYYMEKFKMTPVQYLDKLNILSERFIAAHSILVTDKDIDILEKSRVGIAHNIGANSKGAKGVAPIPEMYARGMKIGLGTDGPMSGNTLDIVTQMSLVGKVHKLFNKDRSIFPAKEIIEMATIGGARVLNLDKEIGSIEIGKKADLVIFETESLNMQPIYDYYSVLVYSANPSNVNTVLVDGKILVDNKKLLNINLSELKDKLNSCRTKILHAANKL
jgi:cytosine/adenosine deaminase-related metal-dependent hydrolase